MPAKAKTPSSASPKKPAKEKSSATKTKPAKIPPVKNEDDIDKDVVLLTEDGLKALREELEMLKDVKRKEVAKRLKEAISYGDLSENSEYEEAKNEQAFIEGRILDLEKKVKHVKIIAGQNANIVRIGSTVVVLDMQTNAKEEYTIVGSTEADPMAQRISNESPVGRALLGKKKGDKVKVEAPGGIFEYEILELK